MKNNTVEYQTQKIQAIRKYVVIEPSISLQEQKLIYCNTNIFSITDNFHECLKYSRKHISNLKEWSGERLLPNIQMAVKVENLPLLEKIIKNKGVLIICP